MYLLQIIICGKLLPIFFYAECHKGRLVYLIIDERKYLCLRQSMRKYNFGYTKNETNDALLLYVYVYQE